MTPTTLQQKADQYAADLARDPALFGSVLDGLLEKKASAETPAEVLKMAADVEKDTGATKEASLRIAWDSYLRYVNPDYVKTAKHLPPWLKKKDGKGDGKAKDKGKGAFGGKKAPPFGKKAEVGPITKEAQDLARALGI